MSCAVQHALEVNTASTRDQLVMEALPKKKTEEEKDDRCGIIWVCSN